LKVVEMEHNGSDTACCGRHTSRYPNYGGMISTKRLRLSGQMRLPSSPVARPAKQISAISCNPTTEAWRYSISPTSWRRAWACRPW
jgi:hypothetical protein